MAFKKLLIALFLLAGLSSPAFSENQFQLYYKSCENCSWLKGGKFATFDGCMRICDMSYKWAYECTCR